MKNESNSLLKFALDRANRIRKGIGQATFDLSRIRNDWSPRQNTRAFGNLFGPSGRFEFCNDVNSGIHENGVLSKLTDAAIARYLWVQKGASLATNVAVGTSGQPLGFTIDASAGTTDFIAIKLLGCSPGTCIATSDGSAAIAYGDLLTFVTGGLVKTYAGTTGAYVLIGIALEAVGNTTSGADAEFEISPIISFRSVA